jgi:hypothetical protein
MGSGPTGAPTQFSLSAIAPGTVPSQQMPPEVLTAIVASAQKIAALIDSYSQATPDMASDWDGLKQQLQMVLAKLMTQGAGAMSPTATGGQFPGGGMDRGISGAGTV